MADFAKENQFTPDQQAEIDAGIKDNIDVSIYAKPCGQPIRRDPR